MKTGNISTVHTARGLVVETVFAVIDASKLRLSHDPVTLAANPDYPSELQPRERDRIASDQQIEYMRKNLKPELLGDSLNASEGSPILGRDLIVESGNARGIAIVRAYSKDTATTYRRWLIARLKEVGLRQSDIKDMPRPVLVRIRKTKVDRLRFVMEANESTVASMSDAEQGRTDANRMTSALLSKFNPRADGEIMHDGNLEFIREFFDLVVSPIERGRYLDSTGYLSQQGSKRLTNAVLAKAFADTEWGMWVLERITEQTEDNVRSISSSLVATAGHLVGLKEAVNIGVRYQLDVTPDLAHALKTLSWLKAEGSTIQDYLAQGKLFGSVKPLEAAILSSWSFARDIGRTTFYAIIRRYIDLAHAQGDPNQLHLVSRPDPTKEELWEQALAEVQADEALIPKRQKGSRAIALVESEVAA